MNIEERDLRLLFWRFPQALRYHAQSGLAELDSLRLATAMASGRLSDRFAKEINHWVGENACKVGTWQCNFTSRVIHI